MPTDPKWRVIARKSGQRVGDVIAVFNFLMVSASANADERGRTQNVVCEDLAAALDLSESDVEAIITAMTGKVITEDGYLTGWEKRQPKREDSSAERAKAWRDERKRTQANAQERADADADADTELKKEKTTSSPKKGARLADDWTPSADDIGFAAERGFTVQETSDAAIEFRNYWLAEAGQRARKINWSLTFRNRIIELASRRGRQTGKPNPGGNRPKPVSMVDILVGDRAAAASPPDLSDDGWLSTGSDGVFVRGPDSGQPF